MKILNPCPRSQDWQRFDDVMTFVAFADKAQLQQQLEDLQDHYRDMAQLSCTRAVAKDLAKIVRKQLKQF